MHNDTGERYSLDTTGEPLPGSFNFLIDYFVVCWNLLLFVAINDK